MIKVLLADDHKILMSGIKSMLQNEKAIEVVGQATTGDEVLFFLEKEQIDVVVLDIEMPGTMGNGIETTKIIRKEYPRTKVLILSMYDKKHFIIKLMEAGAAGYILKDKGEAELINAIHNVYRGKSHYGIDVLNQITRLDKSEPVSDVVLSSREKEVLCLIAEALTSQEIANRLNIAVATVNTHRRNLLQKLEVPNDKHLVRYAIKHKLVEL